MAEKRINWTADEVILVAAEVMANDWKGFGESSEQAQRLSQLLQAAPFHPVEDRGDKFRNANGVGRKAYDIATRHPDYRGTPTNGSKVDREVLAMFLEDPIGMVAKAKAIEGAIRAGQRSKTVGARVEAKTWADDYFEEDASSEEGRVIQAFQRRYERDPRLRELKLESVRREGKPIACEVCGFDFGAFYGERGEGYIEVHHATPLHSTGTTTTSLGDLVLLCSNCHRMIHRKQPWITPSALRYRVMQARRAAGKGAAAEGQDPGPH